MKKIEIEVFSFSELDEKAQKRAADKFLGHYDSSYDYEDFCYDFSENVLKECGLEFVGKVYLDDHKCVSDFIDNCRITDGELYRTKILETSRRIYKMLESGYQLTDPCICGISLHEDYGNWHKYRRICTALDKARKNWETNMRDLKHRFSREWRSQEEYYSSYEFAEDCLDDGYYEFLKNGDRFYE